MALVSKVAHLANRQTRHRHPKTTLPLHTLPSCWVSPLSWQGLSCSVTPWPLCQGWEQSSSPGCYDRDTFLQSSDQTHYPSTQPAQVEQTHRSVSWITNRLFNPDSKTTSLLNIYFWAKRQPDSLGF